MPKTASHIVAFSLALAACSATPNPTRIDGPALFEARISSVNYVGLEEQLNTRTSDGAVVMGSVYELVVEVVDIHYGDDSIRNGFVHIIQTSAGSLKPSDEILLYVPETIAEEMNLSTWWRSPKPYCISNSEVTSVSAEQAFANAEIRGTDLCLG
ncbi:hypothetical protein [Parvularcula marina]|uniref:hypothetical protein n=1 Tax=Parvularcula marina TaxID=2292771 RepID=UPI0011C05C48|nr:hypothetical protein [Parvularcula marina]